MLLHLNCFLHFCCVSMLDLNYGFAFTNAGAVFVVVFVLIGWVLILRICYWLLLPSCFCELLP